MAIVPLTIVPVAVFLIGRDVCTYNDLGINQVYLWMGFLEQPHETTLRPLDRLNKNIICNFDKL